MQNSIGALRFSQFSEALAPLLGDYTIMGCETQLCSHELSLQNQGPNTQGQHNVANKNV